MIAAAVAAAWLMASANGVPAATAQVAPEPVSLLLPPQQRQMTRVQGVVRPFLGVVGNTWGTVSEARVEHYFARPFMVGVELAPVALAITPQDAGAITHMRLTAAYVTDYFAVGFAVGQRWRRFAASGVALAPTLRLGSLDGLNLTLSYGYNIARNKYTGRPALGFSNIMGTIAVPLTRRLTLVGDGGFSLDVWAFATLGLRQRLAGDGGAGTWLASAGFGVAWVSDRTVCNFEAAVPCPGGTALSWGPVVSFGLERRF